MRKFTFTYSSEGFSGEIDIYAANRDAAYGVARRSIRRRHGLDSLAYVHVKLLREERI